MKLVKLLDGLYALDLGLWVKEYDTLVVADFHLGYEEALNKRGVLVPRLSFRDIMHRLKPLLKRQYQQIIINGDLKHEFGVISDQEWQETRTLLDTLKDKCAHLFLIKGNHDTVLAPIAQDVEIHKHVLLGDTYITHGDSLPKDRDYAKASKVVIAHEHPAVSLRDKLRVERYKCFLVGNYKGKQLIVMPSFNLLSPGTDVLQERMLSPFLKQAIGAFEVFVVEDKVYYFGRLANLQESL